MNEVLKVILSMSLSGGIVIIVLFLVLFLFGKKLSRQWQYYIWLIAIVRLLIPFAPQQNLMNVLLPSAQMAIDSIDNGSDEKMQDGQSQMLDDEAELENPSIELQGTKDEVVTKSMTKISDGKVLENEKHVLLNRLRQYLWLVWVLPAVILFIRRITTYKRFIKYIRAGSDDVQDIVLLERFGELLEKYHVRSTIALSVNSVVASPVLIGFFRPCIILPSMEMTDSEFQHTIVHELVHYKRRDIFYKWFIQLTVCIHWFNPLVYAMRMGINKACELSCDEVVIKGLNRQERQAYGDTLLSAAGRKVTYRKPTATITFSDRKKHLKERLDAIMNYQKRTKTTFITTLVLTIFILTGSVYIGVYTAGKDTAAKSTKSGTSDTYSAQAPHSVLYKNGEYFIFFDNAGEKDIPNSIETDTPGSTGPDYGVTFSAVWPDSYISFDSYHINKNLSSKIKKECKHMQNKGWLTKKEANAIIAVALKVQQGDTNGFKTDKQEKEYTKWNITIKNGVYYYENKRIRILMDTRTDRSFENFNYDRKGKVDLKIVRNDENEITKVKYLPKKKAKKILDGIK